MAGKVIWYEDENGNRPVEEFLLAIESKKHRGKIMFWIDVLQKMGVNLGDPYTSQVEGRLRELKADYGKYSYRVFYYWDVDQNIVLLHALSKKTNRIPERDRSLALERLVTDRQRKKKE